MKSNFWRIAAVLGCAWGSIGVSGAADVVLTDGNSVAVINPSSQSGMHQWSLYDPFTQAQVNQLHQQWFWYRVGSTGPEHSIDTISAPSISNPNSRSLSATYATNQFSVRIDYLLTGGAPEANAKADIGETISIQNLSASTLTFHFFQYSFFDISGNGVFGNNTVQLGKNLRGLYNEADQQDAFNSGLSETVTTPGANRGEAAFLGTTLGELNDANPTDLSNANGPIGPGNVTWAFQWDLNIAPGGSAIISKDKYLAVNFVPEPTTAALLGLGMLGLVLRRRKV